MRAEPIDMGAIEDSGWYQTTDGYERSIELMGVELELTARDEAHQHEIVEWVMGQLSLRATAMSALLIHLGGGVAALMEGMGDDE